MPDSSADLLRLDQQVCFPLYAASNLITRLYRSHLAELGLTYPQYLVMLALWERSPQSVGSLGETLHLDSGTLTPLLKRMETNGLVTRKRDPLDERRVQVGLTAAGGQLRNRAADVPAKLGSCLTISAEAVAELRSRARTLVEALVRAEKSRDVR